MHSQIEKGWRTGSSAIITAEAVARMYLVLWCRLELFLRHSGNAAEQGVTILDGAHVELDRLLGSCKNGDSVQTSRRRGAEQTAWRTCGGGTCNRIGLATID